MKGIQLNMARPERIEPAAGSYQVSSSEKICVPEPYFISSELAVGQELPWSTSWGRGRKGILQQQGKCFPRFENGWVQLAGGFLLKGGVNSEGISSEQSLKEVPLRINGCNKNSATVQEGGTKVIC